MSFNLEAAESLPEGVRRIAREQIDQALENLENPGDDREGAVHDARKSCKKLRAVLRLVRGALGRKIYRRENACFRDAAKELAEVRDSAVLIETFDKLRDWKGKALLAKGFDEVRERLVERHRKISHEMLDSGEGVERFSAALRQAEERISDWPLKKDSFDLVEEGIQRVYRCGQDTMRLAGETQTAEDFHDWRKRIKYLWYHVRILSPAWPEQLGLLANQLHHLSDLLGDGHDLAVLAETLQAEPLLRPTPKQTETLLAAISDRRRELEVEALRLGAYLYAEKPVAFVDRLRVYWVLWQRNQ